MDRGLEYMYFQRRYGQQAHDKILNIRKCKLSGKCKSKHNKILPHIFWDSYYQEDKRIKGWQEYKKNCCTLLVGTLIGIAFMENSMVVPQKLKIHLEINKGHRGKQ